MTPTLGKVYVENKAITVVDIPGLIEDAHRGKGLGNEFLAHISRTRLILYLLDPTQDDIQQQLTLLQKEIGSYNQELLDRPQIIAINKIDLLTEKELEEQSEKLKQNNVICISALKAQGLDKLKKELIKWIES